MHVEVLQKGILYAYPLFTLGVHLCPLLEMGG